MRRVVLAGNEILEACVAMGGSRDRRARHRRREDRTDAHVVYGDELAAMADLRDVFNPWIFVIQTRFFRRTEHASRSLGHAPEEVADHGSTVYRFFPTESNAAYAVDGIVPRRVVAWAPPLTLSMSSERPAQKGPIVVRGGGTLLAIGNPPRKFHSLVAMDGMNRMLSYSPEDMVVTVEAGTTLAVLDHELAKAGQRVALEAPNPELSTIGGLAAANFNTGIAHCFGYPRDQILGMTVIDGVGRTLRTGGRVVKNVAGYDLPRVFVGSFGTLGIITDVTLRTQPRPEAVDDIILGFENEQSLEDVRTRLDQSRLLLRSIDVDQHLRPRPMADATLGRRHAQASGIRSRCRPGSCGRSSSQYRRAVRSVIWR